MSIFCIVRKNWLYPPTSSGSYGRHAGRYAKEIWVSFEILKIFYRVNYSGFYFVQYYCNFATILELHFSRLLSSKGYFKVCFEV